MNPQQMTPQQALELVVQFYRTATNARFDGDGQMAVQAALNVLHGVVNPPKTDANPDESAK